MEVFANGDRYYGEYVMDKMEGNGTCMLANGDKYTGELVQNHFEGEGTYYYSDGRVYNGYFDDSLKHG